MANPMHCDAQRNALGLSLQSIEKINKNEKIWKTLVRKRFLFFYKKNPFKFLHFLFRYAIICSENIKMGTKANEIRRI